MARKTMQRSAFRRSYLKTVLAAAAGSLCLLPAAVSQAAYIERPSGILLVTGEPDWDEEESEETESVTESGAKSTAQGKTETGNRHGKVLIVSEEPDWDEEPAEERREEIGEPSAPAKPVPVTLDMKDGRYSIETQLTGGSGRASVSSPTYLTVRNGKAYATLLWSSTHYDYMVMDGVTYYNEAKDGGVSRFTIPITRMDQPIEVTADTTAMGDPVEIRYTLLFYGESIGDTGLIPQEAAKRVLIMAGIMIVAGGILNAFVQRRRRRRV